MAPNENIHPSQVLHSPYPHHTVPLGDRNGNRKKKLIKGRRRKAGRGAKKTKKDLFVYFLVPVIANGRNSLINFPNRDLFTVLAGNYISDGLMDSLR